jgi:hypothetical protein
MSYTTVDKVAKMFPLFQRGVADQAPADAQIQVWIDDAAGDLDAVLTRRFAQAVSNYADFPAYLAALGQDALSILEKLNRWAAAHELAETFASLGNQSAAAQAKQYAELFDAGFNALNGWDDKGRPKPEGGAYDHLFDPWARTETPRPAMYAEAGGDQPEDQKPGDMGMSNKFGKFDPRGT